nr:unnamed protein product [Digitaria exilis]
MSSMNNLSASSGMGGSSTRAPPRASVAAAALGRPPTAVTAFGDPAAAVGEIQQKDVTTTGHRDEKREIDWGVGSLGWRTYGGDVG